MACGDRGGGLDARHDAVTPRAGGDERSAVSLLGEPADHDGGELLHSLRRLAFRRKKHRRVVLRRHRMPEADPLVLDFVEWIAREPRSYSEVIGAWKTSCPRLTIWEDAADLGLVARESVAGFGLVVKVTPDGMKVL